VRFQNADFRFQIGALAIVSVAMAAAANAEVIDRVLAVAGGRIITLSDVTAARALGLQTAGESPDASRTILQKLVDRQLMLAEVDRYAPPEPAAAAIERDVAAVRARFASAAAFDAVLARSGIDERQLRETIRQDLRIRAYLDQRFSLADPRREQLVDEWLAGLRRRAEIVLVP
jgi:hypothetical protein